MKLLDQSAQTNWKFIAIVAFVAVFFTGGILMLIPQLEEQPMPLPPSIISSPNGKDNNNNQLLDISSWQTYRSEEFGFEVKYPLYFDVVEANSNKFNAASSRTDKFTVELIRKPLDGFEYGIPSGSISFVYSEAEQKWTPKFTSPEEEKFAPKAYRVSSSLTAYISKESDAATSAEIALIEDPSKRFIVQLAVSRNTSFLDCITPCPESIPLSNDETIFSILNSLHFLSFLNGNANTTDNWKIYRNEEFGFKMRYPSNWQFKEAKIKQTFKIPFISEVYATEPLNFYQMPLVFSIELQSPENKMERDSRGVPQSIVISVRRPENTVLFYEIIKDLESYERVMRKYFKEGRIVNKSTLAGKSALYSKRNVGTGDESIEYLAYDGYDEEVDVFLNENLYSIYRNGDYYAPYFDQIVSTFRFVE